MTIKARDSASIVLNNGEKMDVKIYSKSTVGAKFSVVNAADKNTVLSSGSVEGLNGGNELTITEIATSLVGPGRFKIYGEAVNSRFYSSSENYLVVGNISNV